MSVTGRASLTLASLPDQSQVSLDSYILRLWPHALSWSARSHSHNPSLTERPCSSPDVSLPVWEASVAPSSGRRALTFQVWQARRRCLHSLLTCSYAL